MLPSGANRAEVTVPRREGKSFVARNLRGRVGELGSRDKGDNEQGRQPHRAGNQRRGLPRSRRRLLFGACSLLADNGLDDRRLPRLQPLPLRGQVDQHFPGALVPLNSVLREAFIDQPFEFNRHPGANARQRLGLLVDNFIEQRLVVESP